MQLFSGYCQVLLVVLTGATVLRKDDELIQQQPYPTNDEKFAEVIKNITRVNDVLEHLIKNYVKLKKMYESEEMFTSDETKGGKLERSILKPATTTRKSFLATQMFMSASEDSGENEIGDTKEVYRAPKIEYQILEKEENTNSDKKNKNNDDVSSSSDSSNNSDEEKSDRKIVENYDNLKVKIVDHSNIGKIMNDQISKEIGIEIPTKTVSNKSKTGNKTGVDQIKVEHFIEIGNNVVRPSDRSKTVKQIVYTENFSNNNIWDDIINNKPVQLKEGTVNFRSKRKNQASDTQVYFRNQEESVTEESERTTTKTEQNGKDHSQESLEDEKTIRRDQFQSLILRKAYGDACSKVVIRKCYKSCKAVMKSVCSSKFKCKSDFKTSFKNASKKGCLKEFQAKHHKRTQEKGAASGTEAGFQDFTRNDDLAATCFPYISSNDISFRRDKDQGDKELNILRDRFERACQKISSEKCTNACRHAVESTCTTKNCKSDKRKAFHKACNTECQHAYSYGNGEKSESSSSASRSSSGSSESDSDSDSEEEKKEKDKKRKVEVNKKRTISDE